MRLLITAGPTYEPIDPVRFLGNRSSGKLGVALAQEAATRGHDVLLLGGPGLAEGEDYEATSYAIKYFESSRNLEALLAEHFPGCDALIMAAAVADHRPAHVSPIKLARDDGPLTLTLEATPDLVAAAAAHKRPDQRVIAFALEDPATLDARAADKLRRKRVDALVANPLTTVGSDAIDPIFLRPGVPPQRPGRMSKAAFAAWLLDRLETMPTIPR